MLTSPPAIEYEPAPALSGAARRTAVDDFDRAAVAALSDRDVLEMGDDELIWTIQATRLPFADSALCTRLKQLDRPTLEKLLYLARRCCRNLGY